MVAQTGDTLVVTNPDPIGHNANLQFLANTPQNILIPAGQKKEVPLELPERRRRFRSTATFTPG